MRGWTGQTLKHVFEPFFTTKEVGRGSGLGLATVHGIVEQSGGFVTVGSERGRGTTFRIYLPLVGRPGPDMPPEPAAADIGGAESILVVEDDASVRAILARTLSANGYDVHQAGDGAEALALICRMAGGIDLVIADVVMPRIGGRELADTIAGRFPTIPVLLISGYPGPEAAGAHWREENREFIQKPLDPEQLTRKVRSLLDSLKDRAGV